ncbi:hypothetical protein AAC03nite_37810 [Alicyclobacillus acidoterrestris]|nr:hypothetical protein AAC03nite_37810 [Alicyclobacillus acidoterrestris]
MANENNFFKETDAYDLSRKSISEYSMCPHCNHGVFQMYMRRGDRGGANVISRIWTRSVSSAKEVARFVN